jgi:hypothetical protein
MKLEWGKKVSCPACALRLYDLRASSITCPYCGNVFGDNIEARFKKKNYSAETEIDSQIMDSDDSVVLDGDDITTDVDVIKPDDFE